jgi:hypothetical protein
MQQIYVVKVQNTIPYTKYIFFEEVVALLNFNFYVCRGKNDTDDFLDFHLI